MAVLTGKLIIDVYGFNDGEIQTIQVSEKASKLSCGFNLTNLNKWTIDNVEDYEDFSYRLELTQNDLINLKKNISSKRFDDSNLQSLIRPDLYLELLNEVKREDGFSVKTYRLFKKDTKGIETLAAELNIDFEFKSIILEEPSGETLLDTKTPDFIGKANPEMGYETLVSYDELDKWTRLRFEIEPKESIILERAPMEPIDIVLPIPSYAKGSGYGLKTFIGSNFFKKDKQVEIGLNESTDETIYESRPKIYGINKTDNTLPTTPTPFIVQLTKSGKITIPASDYLEPLSEAVGILFKGPDLVNTKIKYRWNKYIKGKPIEFTVQDLTHPATKAYIKITETETTISPANFTGNMTIEAWMLKDYS